MVLPLKLRPLRRMRCVDLIGTVKQMSGGLTPFALTSSAAKTKEMIPEDSDEQKWGKAERLPIETKGGVYGEIPLPKEYQN